MSKTVHVTFSNHSDLALARTAVKGSWTAGFEAPESIDAQTACEWQTDGDGSLTYAVGSDGAQISLGWNASHGGSFNFDLSEGWELLGTAADQKLDLHLSPTTPHVVEGFAPSTHGFAFPNAFPENVALRTIDLGVTKLPIGDASNGLCGGMAFGARDFFEAGETVPALADPPVGEGNPFFDYLVQRLIDTFDLPHLPATLLTVMNPAYPAHDGGLLGHVGADGRARLMARSEFGKIRDAIDSGKPCPICIVKAKSLNPADLGQNHQILVYGYEVDGTQLTLWAYDPNNPGRDDAGLVLDIGHTDRDIEVGVSIADLGPIYCYIVTNYEPAAPPPLDTPGEPGDDATPSPEAPAETVLDAATEPADAASADAASAEPST